MSELLKQRLSQVKELADAGLVEIDFERMLETHYRRWLRPGDTVLDVGCHAGRHLFPMLECIGSTGRAIAFEPLPFACAQLAARAAGTRATVENLAIGNATGRVTFTHATGAPEESGLRQRIYNVPETANPVQIEVQVETLDRYCANLESLAFIKIDIEGAEIDLLKGAKATIARLRPLISVEYGFQSYSVYGHRRETLFEIAGDYGYVLYDIFLNRLDTLEKWRIGCDYMVYDFVMVPLERQEAFETRMSQEARASAAAPSLPDRSTDADALALQVERLGAQVESMLTSTSWRMTAPMRAIGKVFRRPTTEE